MLLNKLLNMGFFFFFFFLVVGLSIIKSSLLKLVIVLEFMYMIIVFFFFEFFSITLDMLMSVMLFSASEGIMALCLVMVFSKFFQVKDSVYLSF